MSTVNHYLGNPKLKKANITIDFSKEEIQEVVKCSKDIIYFCEKYLKIINIDEGLMPYVPYDYQKQIMHEVNDNRFVICKMPRQTGKTTTMVAIMLHYALFNPDFNIAILANKSATAREILGRLQLAYENLPWFLQQGIVEWNKGNIVLENGSKIFASSTSASAIRGMSINLVYLDEFAFVPSTVQEEFFNSVYPTISSGRSSRVLITSTPNGMNMFYKLWHDAEKGYNDYATVSVNWWDVPGRDEEWKAQTIRNTSEKQFAVEFECEFLGSSSTLIDPHKLRNLVFKNPDEENENLKIFEKPTPEHIYTITADTSRGVGNDYSAFTVIDVTEVPYKVVATYRSNTIAPVLYPKAIYNAARAYNNAHVLIEINDIGQQVADILHHDMEYESIISAQWKGRAGQIVGGGFGGGDSQLGIRTTPAMKRIGCSMLKTIVENDRIIINDFDILSELTTFVANKRGTNFEAEPGQNDDLAMCLVFFAWLTNQDYFKELTDIDIRKNLYELNQQAMEDQLVPFGIIDDGNTNDEWQEDDEFKGGTRVAVEGWDYEGIDEYKSLF
tara:strand:- start:311 stop:1984 length:1674 start_codon:yes stop_codon:yes gene_type:complete